MEEAKLSRVDDFPLQAKKSVELLQKFRVLWKLPKGRLIFQPDETYVGGAPSWNYVSARRRDSTEGLGELRSLITVHHLATGHESTITQVRQKAIKVARDQVDTCLQELE